MQLGRLGVWTFLDLMSAGEAAAFVQRVEALGYSTLWLPEAIGRDPFALIGYLMARTEQYWAGRHADDVVKLAQETRALARQVATAAKAHSLTRANTAFEKMNKTCNTCHDLHPEKRP